MDLSKIISVAGKSGLFRVVAQARNAVIAESLLDGKRIPVHNSMRVNSLEEISMFTTGDDVPLKEVLAKLHEHQKGAVMDPKADEGSLWSKLGEVLPEHDRERIYPSDLRKLFAWYEQLVKAGEFDRKEEAVEEKATAPKVGKETAGEKAPKKAAATKAKAPKPAAPTKAKTTAVRKGSQRGS